MIVQFRVVDLETFVGEFNNTKIEIRKSLEGNWRIWIGGRRTKPGPFATSLLAKEHVESVVNKIIVGMETPEAKQKPMSNTTPINKGKKYPFSKLPSHVRKEMRAKGDK